MLALLPQILFLGAFAATLIRVVVALMMAYDAWQNIARPSLLQRGFAMIEIVLAAMLFVGAWTQAVAIVTAALLAISLFSSQFRVWPRSTVALLLVMTLTLIVTGPGALAFDLPL